MKHISNDEYDDLMTFMKSHILNLWSHENVIRNSRGNDLFDYTQIGFPITNIYKHNVEGNKSFYLVYNNLFLSIVSEQLKLATERFPESFGTGNPNDVITALFRLSGVSDCMSQEQYTNILANKPCYVVYKDGDRFCDDILRIDLFRDIHTSEDGSIDFRGGFFHSLKHFSLNGINLSIGNDNKTNVFDVYHVVYLIAMAFIEKTHENNNDYISIQQLYGCKYPIKYIFYNEIVSGVFFLTSCHIVHD